MPSRRVQRTVVILNPNYLVGEKIKSAREQAGLTQLETAIRVNKVLLSVGAIAVPLHRSGMARLETGERGLKYLEAWAIAQVLGVKTEEFLPTA